MLDHIPNDPFEYGSHTQCIGQQNGRFDAVILIDEGQPCRGARTVNRTVPALDGFLPPVGTRRKNFCNACADRVFTDLEGPISLDQSDLPNADPIHVRDRVVGSRVILADSYTGFTSSRSI